ncbi:histidine kinase [Sphingomonas sp. Leaf412]|uniref:sensor histidine kinase n=1 Tax=Sphingomonas sp. Leaf412 TaxID=1736370 RepID=UPI0006F9DC15|nr:sensor histidine kinase [Sphingomonas sp. Leaf412]KQT34815.1 histidine kinase [Sphingomonas sp. Leaf412]
MVRRPLPFVVVREGSIGRRLALFMILGFVALIGAGGAATWVMSENERHARMVAHTYQVENAILDSRRLIEQAETTRRGFLLMPEDRGFLRSYREAAAQLPAALARLRALTGDNPRQQAQGAAIGRAVAALAARREDTVAMVANGDAAAGLAAFRRDDESARLRTIRAGFDRMLAEERRLLAQRDAALRASERLFYAVVALAGLLLVGVALVSLATILAYTRDLARSRDALSQMNEGLEGIVAERTSDLTRANDEIQRFAYIVSHDLRSPLVNVMGFTAELEGAAGTLRGLVERAEEHAPDLVTQDDRLAAREDLPEAIGFIRSSTQKMDRLITAILQLSRHGRRVLTPEPIDLAQMVAGIGDTLAHRLDSADAVLAIDGTLPVMVTDRFSIDQILSNLIENAVKYLRRGVPGRIVVRGHRAGARAILEVADNGRGIDARDHDRVFDLFRRSGTQDVAGEGIGLATVRALAFRLGGTIDVTSTPGQGTTFRLNLPLTLDAQENRE